MKKVLAGALKYSEIFDVYPDRWVLIKPITRDGTRIKRAYVLESSRDKDVILSHAVNHLSMGKDVAVVPTMDCMDDSVVSNLGCYVSPEESAFLFNMYFGVYANTMLA